MDFSVRPPDGITIIGDLHDDYIMFKLYCEDELENSIIIILTQQQMKELKKSINSRNDIDKND